MDSQTGISNTTNVPNSFEPLPNDSERRDNSSERFRTIRNESENRSERVPHVSEQKQDTEVLYIEPVPNGSERTTNTSEDVPNGSEQREDRSERFPNRSEETSTADEHAQSPRDEQYRTTPLCNGQHTACTITVREAARIFEEAGVPRTERAITNWCKQNARGIIRLDCCYNAEERKYYITPESINRVIHEERKKMQYIEYRDGGVLSTDAEELSEHLRNDRESEDKPKTEVREKENEPVVLKEEPRTERTKPSEEREKERSQHTFEETREQKSEFLAEDERQKLKELQMENYELRVQLEGQKYLIRQFDSLVDGERERHEREKLALVDRLTDARHEIGTLEQQLLQLQAPSGVVREAEAELRGEHTGSSGREGGV